MPDLTVIYTTANRMPQKWVDFHMEHLVAAIKDYPVIAVSSEPIDLGLGERKLIQEIPYGGWSTYCMWNRAAKLADTKFVAIAEDDSLYHPWHFYKYFKEFKPNLDEAVYDMSRWTVMTWFKEKAVFSMLRRLGGFMMICPRDLLIEALDEREGKFPNGFKRPGEIGREDSELRMGVTRRKHVEWYCKMPSITLAHTLGVSPTYLGPTGKKRKEGEMKAIEIPYWGKAADIAAIFNEGVEEEAMSAETS
jgi:hypothetical protein